MWVSGWVMGNVRSKQVFKAMLLVVALVAMLLGLAMVAVLYFDQQQGMALSFVQVLNMVLVGFYSLLFPLIQRGQARWLWHTAQRSAQDMPEWMSEKAPPLPKTTQSWPQRLLKIGLQLLAMLLLCGMFGPYGNQHFLLAMAADWGISLTTYLLGVTLLCTLWLAMVALLVGLLLQQHCPHVGKRSLSYSLWRNWLSAYVLAFALCAYMALLLGWMLVVYLG